MVLSSNLLQVSKELWSRDDPALIEITPFYMLSVVTDKGPKFLLLTTFSTIAIRRIRTGCATASRLAPVIDLTMLFPQLPEQFDLPSQSRASPRLREASAEHVAHWSPRWFNWPGTTPLRR